MSVTARRVSALTAILCLAAGTTALASLTVTPSTSITLEVRTRGMNNGDPEAQRAEIASTSDHGQIEIKDGCRNVAEIVSGSIKSRSEESEGTGQPYKKIYYLNFILQSKPQPGECTITLSDGSRTEHVRVRVVKP